MRFWFVKRKFHVFNLTSVMLNESLTKVINSKVQADKIEKESTVGKLFSSAI